MKILKAWTIFQFILLAICIPPCFLEAAESPLIAALHANSSGFKVQHDLSGGGVVTWLDYDGTYTHLWAKTFRKDNAWSDPMLITFFVGKSPNDAQSLAVDSAGNA